MEKFDVSCTFSQDAAQVDPTPGAGQLAEEIVAALDNPTKCLTPSMQDGPIRKYIFAWTVDAESDDQAAEMTTALFKDKPGVSLYMTTANQVAPATEQSPPADLKNQNDPPKSDAGAEGTPVKVQVRFTSPVSIPTLQEVAPPGFRLHPNGTKPNDIIAYKDELLTDNLDPMAIADDLRQAIEGSHGGSSFNLITAQIHGA